MKNIITIIFFTILYFIFVYYFSKDNQNKKQKTKYLLIKITGDLFISSELLNIESNYENFSNINKYSKLIYFSQEDNKIPKFCNNKNNNVNCKFPVFKVNDNLISINNIKELITSYDKYINNLNYNKKDFYRSVGYYNYDFNLGKIYFNNIKYCNFNYGGFQKSKEKKEEVNNCNLDNQDCILENNKYYLKKYDLIDNLCIMKKNYEIIGSLKCSNDLVLDSKNKICLPIHIYIPLLLIFCKENNLEYLVQVENYSPPNITSFMEFLNTKENSEENYICPENSYSTNDSCICKEGFKCIGFKCETNNSFDPNECYNCACVEE
jgi:hypothetical protein